MVEAKIIPETKALAGVVPAGAEGESVPSLSQRLAASGVPWPVDGILRVITLGMSVSVSSYGTCLFIRTLVRLNQGST